MGSCILLASFPTTKSWSRIENFRSKYFPFSFSQNRRLYCYCCARCTCLHFSLFAHFSCQTGAFCFVGVIVITLRRNIALVDARWTVKLANVCLFAVAKDHGQQNGNKENLHHRCLACEEGKNLFSASIALDCECWGMVEFSVAIQCEISNTKDVLSKLFQTKAHAAPPFGIVGNGKCIRNDSIPMALRNDITNFRRNHLLSFAERIGSNTNQYFDSDFFPACSAAENECQMKPVPTLSHNKQIHSIQMKYTYECAKCDE